MTKIAQFKESLSAGAPGAELDLALEALWWAGKGKCERAHTCVQQAEGNRRCDLVHAFLHRQEGDEANARYWYRRADEAVPTQSLTAEWTALAQRLLAS